MHMTLLRVVVGLSLLMPSLSGAQTCGVGSIPLTVVPENSGASPYITVAPTPPTSASPLNLLVGMTDYIPSSAAASVDGRTINVTLTASFYGFTTPPAAQCSSASIGRLSSGSYVVNLNLVDTSTGDPNPTLVATGSLVVGGGIIAPVSAPAIGPFAIAMLAMLVLLAAFRFIGRAKSVR